MTNTNTVSTEPFTDYSNKWWYKDGESNLQLVITWLNTMKKEYAHTNPWYVMRLIDNQIYSHNSDYLSNNTLPRQMDIVQNLNRSNRQDEISITKLSQATEILASIQNNIEVTDYINIGLKEYKNNVISELNGYELPNGITYSYGKNTVTKKVKNISSENYEAQQLLAHCEKLRNAVKN